MRFINVLLTYLLTYYSIQHGTDNKTGLRLSVYPSVGTLTVAFLDRFSPKLTQT